MKIKRLLLALFKITSYACFIKTKHSDLYLVLNDINPILSWYKEADEKPFVIETDNEITRLMREDTLNIRYRPVPQIRGILQPAYYALIKPQKNLVRPFFVLLFLGIASIWGWSALEGKVVTAMVLARWCNFALSIVLYLFGIALLFIGWESAIKASRNIARSYWTKFAIFDSLGAQVLAIGAISVILPQIISSINLH